MPDDILARIRELNRELGEGINEDIVSDLIQWEGASCEHGFAFLRISEGFAVFSVPSQNHANWYGKVGRLAVERKEIARKIAKKYHLHLYEPPAGGGYIRECHHHFELMHEDQTLIVAHPRYVKIRITGRPVIQERNLLENLSALYHDTSSPAQLKPCLSSLK